MAHAIRTAAKNSSVIFELGATKTSEWLVILSDKPGVVSESCSLKYFNTQLSFTVRWLMRTFDNSSNGGFRSDLFIPKHSSSSTRRVSFLGRVCFEMPPFLEL